MAQNDVAMPDAPKANSSFLSEKELDEKFPNRPKNFASTLPFHDLYLKLFNPLNENKKPVGRGPARRKVGPHGPSRLQPHEVRRNIIERFISRWRQEVGPDLFPVFRLIMPDKDRDRAMYGLKEKAIGRLLVKVMRINPNSDDGKALIDWKIPGQSRASRMAGDFAGRCGEVIRKRPMRTEAGDMTIEEVNTLLDQLATEGKEAGQLPIFQNFYSRMNADELTWLVRIIVRQMKVGATERTFFDIWHPDATNLFNISSSLRRVCWELYDENFRLEGEDKGISVMQCFQPQLAQFQMHSFQKMVDKMQIGNDSGKFWVEEKLDGERMQMHVVDDPEIPGGKRFSFWSRKAKDYTYLYGSGLYDNTSSLTRYLKDAFHEGVESIILDGEMITWDREQDAIAPFGTLKTAALATQKDPYSETAQRPLFKVFDILCLNGKNLANYELIDRRKALEASVESVHRRMEIHTYREASTANEIDELLREIVSQASEGLVLKNPKSPYRLNERNDNWMKVKPEYMTEFGENMDCIIVGGYYGSGHRGGKLSSFLCGLRIEDDPDRGSNPQKCFSFFKVGGGLTAGDYANIRHKTNGKWITWDSKKPPSDWIELAGGHRQYEQPDEWIKPSDSVVISVKAASVNMTESFRTGFTLRFPRFKAVRDDRDWKSALSLNGFNQLRAEAEQKQRDHKFEIDQSRRNKKVRTSKKKPITVLGAEVAATPYAGEPTNVFEGLSFCVLSDCQKPEKKSKAELEQMIKANGGKFFQSYSGSDEILCIGDRNTVKVAALMKRGDKNIIRPWWLFDAVTQSFNERDQAKFIVPLEPKHMFHVAPEFEQIIGANADQYGDGFARDVTVNELRDIIAEMPKPEGDYSTLAFRTQLQEQGHDLPELRSSLFQECCIYVAACSMENIIHSATIDRVALRQQQAKLNASFGGATIHNQLVQGETTQVVVPPVKSKSAALAVDELVKELRQEIATWQCIPRIVSVDWIEQSWDESTIIDEERFAVVI